MAEQFLDGSQICSTLKHMRGGSVSQAVRRNHWNTRKSLCRKGYCLSRSSLIEATTAESKKECVVTLRCHQRRTSLIEPGIQARFSWDSEWDDSLLVPLTYHPNRAARKVNVGDIEPTEFADAYGRGVEQLKNCGVAQSNGRARFVTTVCWDGAFRAVKNFLHLFTSQHRGKLPRDPRRC